ncbi:MAG: electron transport complex subunit E [Candidatus Lindowbacteria bacterium]|nr:electron transport complex subunit E [Candidatus Lindowbacteria bacterium]
MSNWKEFSKGFWDENPTFRLVLGMCAPLAITTSLINGVGMGVGTTAVLVASNIWISILRNSIPNQIRIPCFIVVIAAFTTIVDLSMHAFTPALYEALGIFIPLIVVNCIILGRAEAFASKNKIWPSVLDGFGMGLAFTINLTIIGGIRELLGTGQLLGRPVVPSAYQPSLVMILPPGAFITLAFLIAGMNIINRRLEIRRAAERKELK